MTDPCLKSGLILLCIAMAAEFAIWWIFNANFIVWCLKLVSIYRCQTEFTIWCICNAFYQTDVSSWYWCIDAKQNFPFGDFVMLFYCLMSQVGIDIHVSTPNRLYNLVYLLFLFNDWCLKSVLIYMYRYQTEFAIAEFVMLFYRLMSQVGIDISMPNRI